MAFRKYQRAERSRVLKGREKRPITNFLKKVGKTRVSDLSEEERKRLADRW